MTKKPLISTTARHAANRALLNQIAALLHIDPHKMIYDSVYEVIAGYETKIIALTKERDIALEAAKNRHTLLTALAELFPQNDDWQYGKQLMKPAEFVALPELVKTIIAHAAELDRFNREVVRERDDLSAIVEEARLLLDTPLYRSHRDLVDRIGQKLGVPIQYGERGKIWKPT